MTVVRRSSFSSILFLCFPLVATLGQTTTDDTGFDTMIIQAISCSTSGNYTSASAYYANLSQFLAALPENAVSNNGGFFKGAVGEGTATVYGLAMCAADYSRADCSDCIATTCGSKVGGLPNRCPGSTTVLAVYDKCLVRYSETNFLGTPETDIMYSSGGAAPSSAMDYSGKVQDRLQLLTDEAATSPQRFAASATIDPPYALMQCTWDLPPGKCKECLDVLSANASDWISMTVEGERKTYSCTLRYSNTSFSVVPFKEVDSSGSLPPRSSSVNRTTTRAAPPSSAKGSRTVVMVIESVSAVGVAALLLVCCVWRVRSWSQHKRQDEDIKPTSQNQSTRTPSASSETIGEGQWMNVPFTAATSNENDQGSDTKVYVPRPFTYVQLAKATSNFAKKEELGHGAFGAVYKGRLPGLDMAVAIKEIIETSTDQAKKAFNNEIRIMSKLHHRNIVRLLGWCDEDKHLLLIYEIMENGNLEDRLHPRTGTTDSAVYGVSGDASYSSSQLSWIARRNILMGIASGLQYLHMDCPEAILHRDIKPANVMLDKNFNAKLADFGLVTQLSHTQTSHPTDNVIGTRSYIDPAYMETGKASGQSDVYSLGVMLLEIVCGKKPIIMPDGKNSLIEEVRKCRAGSGENSILEAADRGLRGQFDGEIKTVLELGLSCVRTDRHNRPHTGLVRYKLVQLAGGLRSIPPSASRIHRRSREEFPTHFQGDQEAGEFPLLTQNRGKMPASTR